MVLKINTIEACISCSLSSIGVPRSYASPEGVTTMGGFSWTDFFAVSAVCAVS
jgi:hypothetical protein